MITSVGSRPESLFLTIFMFYKTSIAYVCFWIVVVRTLTPLLDPLSIIAERN